jgi:hypothetical protein
VDGVSKGERCMERAIERDKWGELDGENLDGEKGRE